MQGTLATGTAVKGRASPRNESADCSAGCGIGWVGQGFSVSKAYVSVVKQIIKKYVPASFNLIQPKWLQVEGGVLNFFESNFIGRAVLAEV